MTPLPTIGLCVSAENILKNGFPTHLPVESWSIVFWHVVEPKKVESIWQAWQQEAIQKPIASLSIYGNPLASSAKGELARLGWQTLIERATDFHTDVVSGFTGRVASRPWKESEEPFAKTFAPLSQFAENKGVRLAFENCRMRGNWKSGNYNLAFTPLAWERIFTLLPMHNIGLEWDPSHLLESLIDPYENFTIWKDRIFHIHGKDGNINHNMLESDGVFGADSWLEPAYPVEGSIDWKRIWQLIGESNCPATTVSIENPQFGKPDNAKITQTYAYFSFLRDTCKNSSFHTP